MIADIIVQTLLVTPSGAFSPGPLTTAAVVEGAVRATPKLAVRAGLKVAAGHMAFELPYVLALSLLANFLAFLRAPLAAISLAFSLFFAYLTIKDGVAALRGGYNLNNKRPGFANPLVAGLVFTGANPYFLMWWATVGLPLVNLAVQYGALGVAVMYASHVWMDYFWLALMASLGGGASKVLGSRKYGYLLIALAALLLLFGVNIFLKAFTSVTLIP
ncbi:MAG: LysE family transporter [Thermoproteus sp.]